MLDLDVYSYLDAFNAIFLDQLKYHLLKVGGLKAPD